MVFECLRDFFDVVLGFILEKKGFTYFFMPIFVVGIWGETRGLTVSQLKSIESKRGEYQLFIECLSRIAQK